MSEDRAVVRAGALIIGANIALWTSEPWAPILAAACVIAAGFVLRNATRA